MRSIRVALIVGTVLAASAPALARAEQTPAATADLRLTAGPSIHAGENALGVGVGGAASFRYGLFSLGGFGEARAGLGGSGTSVGASAGIAWQAESGLRLGLAPMVGLRTLSRSSATASLPFVGGQAAISYRFSRDSSVHFDLGASLSIDSTLSKSTKTYDSTTTDWWTGKTETTTQTATFGGVGSSAMVTLGVVFDVVKPRTKP